MQADLYRGLLQLDFEAVQVAVRAGARDPEHQAVGHHAEPKNRIKQRLPLGFG